MGHLWRGLSAEEEEGLWRGDLEGPGSPSLLHRVSEKPRQPLQRVGPTVAKPQVAFQSPSASGLGELMFCWWTQKSVVELQMFCAYEASPGPQLDKNKLDQLSVRGQGPD